MIGDFPAAAGRLSIARKTKVDKGSVNFGHGELIDTTTRAGLRGGERLGHLL
jgi:hypothetical protein